MVRDLYALTSWLIEMGEIGKVVAGFEHRRIHQWRQRGIVAAEERLLGDLDGFLLFNKGHISFGLLKGRRGSERAVYLAIVEFEDQLGLAAINGLADELGGYPALGSIRLPRPGANIVGRSHLGAAQPLGRWGRNGGGRRDSKGSGTTRERLIGGRHS